MERTEKEQSPLIYGENWRYIGVLDGIRAFSVWIICCFHFWQQNWLQYYIPEDIFWFLGYREFSVDWLVRYGYLFVEVLLLLSSFLLFLPVAGESMAAGREIGRRDLWDFYKKRIARIVPSYYFVILVYLVFFVRPSDYTDIWAYLRDLVSHLTFTHGMWVDTNIGTHYPGVVWTLTVEVLFYLFFPLIAWCFRRRPLLTYLVMAGAGQGYLQFVTIADPDHARFTIMQFPAFLGVYANGMLGAWIFVFLAKRLRKSRLVYLTATLGALGFFLLFRYLVRFWTHEQIVQGTSKQMPQASFRWGYTLVVVGFILCLAFSAPALRWLFSNGAVRFLSAISYNLYLWHMIVGWQMKELRIPYFPDSAYEKYGGPQMASGEPWYLAWQIKYAVIAVLASVAVAYLATRLVERPLGRLILGKKPVFESIGALVRAEKKTVAQPETTAASEKSGKEPDGGQPEQPAES